MNVNDFFGLLLANRFKALTMSSALRALVRVPSPGAERSAVYERPASPRYMQPTIASATREALTVGVPGESFTRSESPSGFARDGSPSRRRSPSPHLMPPAGGSPNNRAQEALDFGLGEEPRRRIRRTLSAPRPHFSRREKSADSLIRYGAHPPLAPLTDRGADGRLAARGDAVLDATAPPAAAATTTGGSLPMASLAALGAVLAPVAPAGCDAAAPAAAGALTARHDALADAAGPPPAGCSSTAIAATAVAPSAATTYAVEVRGESPPRSLPRPPSGWLTSANGSGPAPNAHLGSHDKSIANAPRSRRSPGRFRPDPPLQVTPGALAAASPVLMSDAGFDSSVMRRRARGSCSPHAYRPASPRTMGGDGGSAADGGGGGGGGGGVMAGTASDPNQNCGARFPTAAGFGLTSAALAARSVLSPSRKGRGSCSPQPSRPGSAAGGRVTAADALRWD